MAHLGGGAGEGKRGRLTWGLRVFSFVSKLKWSEPMAYGVASPDQLQGLSGLEMLRAMIAGDLPAAPIAEPLGFGLVEVEPGRAVFEGVPGPHLRNPLGAIHGGYALTLIDSACGCAVHTELDAGVGYTTVETKVNFTRPIPTDGSAVRCEGRVLSRGRQIATAEAFLRSAAGKLLAHGTSTLIILGQGQLLSAATSPFQALPG
jgi:uncharacterized protein (TIGR00369 family)